MSSWKTTLAGLLSGGGILFAQQFPEWQKWGLFASALGSLLMGLAARDNDKSSEEVGAGGASVPASRSSRIPLSLLFLFLIPIVLLCGCVFSGCASGIQRVKKTTTTTSLSTNKTPVVVVEELELNSRLRTLFDAKNTMKEVKVSSGKSASGIGMENVEQTSSGTNALRALEAVRDIMQALPK